MKVLILSAIMISAFPGAAQKRQVDLLVFNATIYTVDNQFSQKEAMAIRDGKIVATGTTTNLKKQFHARNELDVGGKFIYPGFIDAHAHFLEYGISLQDLDLVGTSGWEEILQMLVLYGANHMEGWLIGKGWDQNDWKKKEYPTKEKLDSLFPDRPVFLSRIDGHAAIVNQKALELAGVKSARVLTGGEMLVKNGQLTGVLIDNAVDVVSSHIPGPSMAKQKEALLGAQEKCFAVGLTTIDECGLNYSLLSLIQELQDRKELKMRLYVMLSDNDQNYNFLFQKGPIKTGNLNVRSFKVYADGALGSRGACLLEPYNDRPGYSGFLLSNREHFNQVAEKIYQHGFQMCTHAIGDSGNRMILHTYAAHLKGHNDLRWRIEHAQVINKNDFRLFGQYSIIPSVQPTHATSDMYWAGERLGKEREKGAYAYETLLGENGWIALGTDFPVEDIDPIKTFYAAVFRKDTAGWPENGYQPENALSREQAIRGMTIWAAKANFEEKEKGSLETGKYADFIILDKDLMKELPRETLRVKVMQTYLNGESVFVRNK